MTPEETYKTLLHPKCVVTLVAKSRKKMLDGKPPTKELQKKADACAKTVQKSPAPLRRIAPVPVTPSQPLRIAPLPVTILKPSVNLTDGQKTTAKMMQDLIQRVENKQGVYGRKDKVLW
jgi:hypothetical protein